MKSKVSISMRLISDETTACPAVYGIEAIRNEELALSMNIATRSGKVMDYSGITGDMPNSVFYFLKGQGFDVSAYL